MKILVAAAEMVPLAKVGGLGDVIGALPHALARRGHDAVVILPAYRSACAGIETYDLGEVEVWNGRGDRIPTRVLETWVAPPRDGENRVRVWLVDQPWYFARDGIYNDPHTGSAFHDDYERWLAFCLAVQPICLARGWIPDVIHANDSHTGPLVAMHALRPHPLLTRTGTLFTIHNLAYQGWFGTEALVFAGWDPDWHTDPEDPLEYHGGTNFMKMGIATADIVNTVSERYAYEIRTDPALGCGLEGVLAARPDGVRGITNGIDTDLWCPWTDPHLPAHYSLEDLSGKRVCRDELLAELGLRPAGERTVVMGVVSRLTYQKGIDLILGAVDHMMIDDVRLVVLGTGEPRYQEELRRLEARYPDRLRAALGFSERLAHRIEAGADLFLMPSRYEPCGLNQMYSMRYGTVPVVRWTGGLVDTVEPFDPWRGTGCGFHFSEISPDGLLDGVGRAVLAVRHEDSHPKLIRNCMSQDFSWDRTAGRYEDLYREIVFRRWGTSDPGR